MNDGDKRQMVLSAAWALVFALPLMALLWMTLSDPIALPERSTSPGFGWRWDFDRRHASQDPTPESAADRVRAPADRYVLPKGESVAVGGLQITYRGTTRSGGFRVDVVIPAFNNDYRYTRELTESEARQEFSLAGERFKLLSIGPNAIRLKRLSG